MAAVNQQQIAPAGTRIRVLVVDDSVVIRRLVTQALSDDPQIEVVGVAANGKIALERIAQLNPDLITLDVEMPEMDGMATLRRLTADYPRVRVVMFSSLTEHGGATALEALQLGAADYVTKPANVGSLDVSLETLRDELIPKIKQFFLAAPAPRLAARRPRAVPQVLHRNIVVIGASTGGPNALREIFGALPATLSVPVVLVQHMPPLFTRLLADRLQTQGQIQVREVQGGEELQPGQAYVAPGNYHLVLKREAARVVTRLHQEPLENSCRPAVDVLFRSTAEIYGGAVVAVILTGMGQDGLRGVELLRNSGAYIIAQDEASSVVWGMPGFVARAGLADEVLPIRRVVPRLLRQLH